MIPCSVCNTEWRLKFRTSHLQVPFVCKLCRCVDCQIVLNQACDCGETHGVPSKQDVRVCKECIAIRDRVSRLDPELQAIRNEEFNSEAALYEYEK